MIRKITFFLVIVTLTSCGFEPIYLKKNNLNLSIQKVEFTGDKKVNRRILAILNLKKNIDKNSKYILKLNSEKLIETVAKDKTGNASIYKTTINMSVKLDEKDNVIKEKKFSTSFTYNNSDNKFDLVQYQNNIEVNLTNKIAEQITMFLGT